MAKKKAATPVKRAVKKTPVKKATPVKKVAKASFELTAEELNRNSVNNKSLSGRVDNSESFYNPERRRTAAREMSKFVRGGQKSDPVPKKRDEEGNIILSDSADAVRKRETRVSKSSSVGQTKGSASKSEREQATKAAKQAGGGNKKAAQTKPTSTQEKAKKATRAAKKTSKKATGPQKKTSKKAPARKKAAKKTTPKKAATKKKKA